MAEMFLGLGIGLIVGGLLGSADRKERRKAAR